VSIPTRVRRRNAGIPAINDLKYSGAQTRAALLTATLENQATALGGHAGHETDPAFATTIRGLKRSFHVLIPSIYSETDVPIIKIAQIQKL